MAEATLAARAARPGSPPAAYRRARLLGFTTAGIVLACGGALAVNWRLDERSVEQQLRHVDQQMQAGALSGPGDTALAALLAARAARPTDERVRARAEELARAFELLGDAAAARGDDVEAATHFVALTTADPGRPGALRKLVEARLRTAAPRRAAGAP